ncbi:hypothetical protein GUITHDRAFT_68849 [Guillardia theta CCMP2712]|uniref:Uncharacterized protein n=1 Tax=Guillardia theta (strain CCMP2712) TaxID=905079 RepID=L1JJE2_GUITC|nr:hypothetical protein GUITHDRAFT_68849 [Guillardia theta CCMP2712]EKX48210.1 hypothetical protein GUITHDRAFT_68849 [Guillardia theta CCMP2712]|eukprot:XP_005835190.1 hypothetical protein GUITHDRAFT_68849 [Guillardia theta CCMP2712]
MQAARVVIQQSGVAAVNGVYQRRPVASIPSAFKKVCDENNWDVSATWRRLADENKSWFEHDNGSYIYRNKQDDQWWIDGPDGYGVFVARDVSDLPPKGGWKALQKQAASALPLIEYQE